MPSQHRSTRRRGYASPTVDAMKAQAKRLRTALNEGGVHAANHSLCLELVARMHGYRDWNAAQASGRASDEDAKPAEDRLLPAVGDRVAGRYMGAPFRGAVMAVARFGSDRRKVTIAFDEAVDACGFPSISNLRRRVTAILDAQGRTMETTSDGVPHLILARP